jgi:hypothetical protein
LIIYSVYRFLEEFVRIEPASVGSLSWGQIGALITIVVGVLILLYSNRLKPQVAAAPAGAADAGKMDMPAGSAQLPVVLLPVALPPEVKQDAGPADQAAVEAGETPPAPIAVVEGATSVVVEGATPAVVEAAIAAPSIAPPDEQKQLPFTQDSAVEPPAEKTTT